MIRCIVTADLNRYMRQVDAEDRWNSFTDEVDEELRKVRRVVIEPLESDHPSRPALTVLWSIVDDKGGYWRDGWSVDAAAARKEAGVAFLDMVADEAEERAEGAAEDAAVSRWEDSQY